MTYTFVVLEVSSVAYQEIKDKLVRAGYDDQISEDGLIDMHGIAVKEKDP